MNFTYSLFNLLAEADWQHWSKVNAAAQIAFSYDTQFDTKLSETQGKLADKMVQANTDMRIASLHTVIAEMSDVANFDDASVSKLRSVLDKLTGIKLSSNALDEACAFVSKLLTWSTDSGENLRSDAAARCNTMISALDLALGKGNKIDIAKFNGHFEISIEVARACAADLSKPDAGWESEGEHNDVIDIWQNLVAKGKAAATAVSKVGGEIGERLGKYLQSYVITLGGKVKSIGEQVVSAREVDVDRLLEKVRTDVGESCARTSTAARRMPSRT